jgi:hypothetical protein
MYFVYSRQNKNETLFTAYCKESMWKAAKNNKWTLLGTGLVGGAFTDQGGAALNKTLGMSPAEFGGMVGNMIWTDRLEDMLEARGKKVAANVFDAGDTLGALADLYDVDDLQSIPTRDYYNAYAQAYFSGYEGNWRKLADNYYEKSKGKSPTPTIRQSQEYKDIVAPYSNVSRYYTIKQFKPQDLLVDSCQYIDTKNLSEYLQYADDPKKTNLHPLSDRQFTLDTAKCPASYKTNYNDYYVKNHPDNQVYDCQVYQDYLDQNALFSADSDIVFSNDPTKITSADVQFDMMNSSGKLDLAGSYRMISRPSSFSFLNITTNSTDFARYTVEPRVGNRSKTNFSEDIIYTDTYLTDNETYFYFVITIGTTITGLIAPSPYPRILLKEYVANPLTYDGFMRADKVMDILEWSLNIVQDGKLTLEGKWKLLGKGKQFTVEPRVGNESVVSEGGKILYLDNTTVQYGGFKGKVDATNPPHITWYAGQITNEPNGDAWEPVGLGDTVRYRYKFVQMPKNGGKACDATLDIKDGLLTERVSVPLSDSKRPMDCTSSEKWYHKTVNEKNIHVKKDGWSACWESTGCEKFATRMPKNDDEWSEYESLMCYQRDKEGKVITKKLLEFRQTDKLVAQKNGGGCNTFQLRSNVDSYSNCSVNKDCKYTEWKSTGCFYFTGTTADDFKLDVTKTYEIKSREILEDALNYGQSCSLNVQDYYTFSECPAKACELSEWKTTDCFVDPSTNKAVRYKYKEVLKEAENGGVCDLPQDVLEDCDVSACKFDKWSAWSSCVKTEDGTQWAKYAYRPLKEASSNQVCKDSQYKYEVCPPENCQLAWSEYGACMPYVGANSAFKGKNVQKRMAKVISSGKYGGSCPATIEYKLC